MASQHTPAMATKSTTTNEDRRGRADSAAASSRDNSHHHDMSQFRMPSLQGKFVLNTAMGSDYNQNTKGSTTNSPHDVNENEMVDLEQDASDGSVSSRNKRSKVWKDFTGKNENGLLTAICNHCQSELTAGNKSGTSHLNYHIENSCKVLNKSRKRKGGTPRSDIPSFDQQRSRQDYAKMIAAHNYPFMMAEHYYTRKFINNLQPSFKLVHRTAVREDCIQLYGDEKAKLYGTINSHTGRVGLTSDLWTSKDMHGYMSLTAHYIDPDWKLHASLIGFIHVKTPHTGERVASEMMERLYEWNLDRKICCLVLDNCSVNDVVIREVQKVLKPKKALLLNGDICHIRCAAHILNLIVQDGLKLINGAIANVRESVRYIKHSSTRREKFQQISEQVNAPKITLVTDVPHRWNSIYDMLVVALQFRYAFARYKEREPSYKFCPSNEDWENVQKIIDCLKVFKEVTLRTAGRKFATASLYFMDFCGIYLLLREWKVSEDVFIANMAESMLEKFEKYWMVSNKLLCIATILDPGYKLKSIEYFFGVLYDTPEAQMKVESMKKCFSDLFAEYESFTQVCPPVSKSTSLDTESVPPEGSSSLFATRLGFAKFIKENNSSQQHRSEMEVYFSDPSHPDEDSFDILGWWRLHGPKYPIISRMARDILSVPISTVASESAFSSAGRVLDDYRSNLLPETVEALMCTQDWLRAAIPDHSKVIVDNELPEAVSTTNINQQDGSAQSSFQNL